MIVLTDSHSRMSRGVGLVRFTSVTEATAAIESLHGSLIPGLRFDVKIVKSLS